MIDRTIIVLWINVKLANDGSYDNRTKEQQDKWIYKGTKVVTITIEKVPNAEIIRTVPNLDSWMSLAENRQRREERGERRVNRGEDGAAVTSWQKQVGNCCNDANRGLGPHLAQGLLNGGHPKVVDDLGSLHHLAWSDVEAGHITSNVGIADDRKNPGSHVELVGDLSGMISTRHGPKM